MTNPKTKDESKAGGGFPAVKITYIQNSTVVYVGNSGGGGQCGATTNQNTLKPCPFCGDVEGLTIDDGMVDCRYHEYHVYCESCETEGPIANEERTKEEAIQKWNTRVEEEK